MDTTPDAAAATGPGGSPRPEGRVDADLLALARSPGKARMRDVWRSLTLPERRAAVDAAMRGDEDLEAWARTEVARARHFRRKTVEAWDREKVAAAAALLTPRPPGVLGGLLRRFHLDERGALLAAYLDGLGVEHEDGGVEPDEVDVSDADARGAAGALLDAFPTRRVLLYLLTLRAVTPTLVPGIDGWLPDLLPAPDAASRTDGPPEGAREDEAQEDLSRPPEETDEFTTLDRQVVRAIVDSAQGVEGALDRDEIMDLVEELIALNGTRHRSYFHLGLADVVLDRGPRRELPAQNASRLAWYWSGHVNGLAREGRWPAIESIYANEEAVRDMGVTGTGPSSSGAPLVFRALVRGGRASEAARFLSPEALVNDPSLARHVHRAGTRLLWADRPAEARSLMDLLGAYLGALEREGFDTTGRFFLEVRRRRAHCFRQLNELPKARAILETLLDLESDDEIRSMVLTDLGLVAGGFRSLADIRLPPRRHRLGELRAALEAGEDRFRDGAGVADARYAAHGRYCLGVLAMTRKDWKAAGRDLELALSVFEAERARYGYGDLVARARLYLGISLALSLEDLVRTDRAAELLVEAVAAGVEVPPYLVGSVVEGLALGSEEAAVSVAEALFHRTPAFLDELADSQVLARSRTLLDALLERARDETRGREPRAEDLRTALPHLLRRGEIDEAAAVLDRLEGLARQGVGHEEFIALLEEVERYDPAWSPTDARWSRIKLLLVHRRRDEAAGLLRHEFFRVLHGDGFDPRGEAEDVLEVFRTTDPPEGEVEALEGALAAAAPREPHGPGPEPGQADGRRVRVLFVGGDERQTVTTRRIEAELADTHPRLRVDFVHPGWDSNWGPVLDRIVGRLEHYDAVVVMRFIRTEFGKRLRKAVEIPWVPCHGAGAGTIRRSILRAAEWARNARGRD